MNDIEEEECRVCRSTDDRPLYSPCKCSGSVGNTHYNFFNTKMNFFNTRIN